MKNGKNFYESGDRRKVSFFSYLRTLFLLGSREFPHGKNNYLNPHEEVAWNERLRQAQMSFNLVFFLSATTALLYLVGVYFFWTNQISEGKFSAMMSISSSAISIGCFRLNKDANERLDNLVKGISLDELT